DVSDARRNVLTNDLLAATRPPTCRCCCCHDRLLLSRYAALRSLARTRIRLGSLPVNRQISAVAQPAVAAEIHQTFDVLLHLATEIALHLVFALDDLANRFHVRVRQLLDLSRLRNVRLCADGDSGL